MYSWGVLNYGGAGAGAWSVGHVNSAGNEVNNLTWTGGNGMLGTNGISTGALGITSAGTI